MRFLERVTTLPPQFATVALVSHSHFLRYVVAPFAAELGTKLARPFANAEMRTMWLCPRDSIVTRTSSSERARQQRTQGPGAAGSGNGVERAEL